jgi:hypothetical protein
MTPNDKPACTTCRSERLEPGTLASAAIWLDAQSALSRAFGGVEAKVLACLDCGHVSLRADPEALRKLASR